MFYETVCNLYCEQYSFQVKNTGALPPLHLTKATAVNHNTVTLDIFLPRPIISITRTGRAQWQAILSSFSSSMVTAALCILHRCEQLQENKASFTQSLNFHDSWEISFPMLLQRVQVLWFPVSSKLI